MESLELIIVGSPGFLDSYRGKILVAQKDFVGFQMKGVMCYFTVEIYFITFAMIYICAMPVMCGYISCASVGRRKHLFKVIHFKEKFRGTDLWKKSRV